MELMGIDGFTPKGATVEIIEDVDREVAEINRHRPLPHHINRKLSDDLLYDRIYSSAVTEGNRLSRRETIAVLSAGIIEAGTRKDVTEIRNLGQAILRLDEFLGDQVPISEGFIRELHKMVLSGMEAWNPGCYRKHDLAIAGSKTVPPAPGDVPSLVKEVVDVINKELETAHPVVLAAWAHWAITRIHPFGDGNGRVARLVQDFILIRRRYVPTPLFPEDREGQYYDALEAADEGDSAPFIELLSKNVVRVADRYVSAIREDSLKTSWLEEVTKAAAGKIRESEHRRFIRWERRIRTLRMEFVEIATELTRGVPGLRIKSKDFQGVDLEKYKALRSFGHAERTWAFGVEVRHEDTRLRFVFWIGTHFPRRQDPEAEMTEDPVLLVSMEEQESYRRLDELNEDMISLREIILRNGEFARRRYNPAIDGEEWDFNVSPGQIARDFFREVLQKLFLI